MLLSASSGSSAGPIELGVRFFLKDEFSGRVTRMKEAMTGLRGEFTAFQDNLRAARSITTSIAAGGAALLAGMGSQIAEGADFLYMMRSVEAISDATASQMTTLADQAVRVGRETMFFPKDIAEGMRFMAMAGQDADRINKTIESATNLAGATLTQVGGKMGAADILTNALKAFGWEAERSSEMSDILVLATNNANVSLNDLGNSIRYVAATSRNLRIPVQETTGLLMSLGNAGIQASMAGVATENMYRYLAMSLSEFSTKRAQSAWASLGIDKKTLVDSRGNLIPITQLLGKIKTQLSGFGSVEQQNILRDIFGVRGLRAAATLINNLDEAQGFIDKLKDPANAGTAAEKMALMMDSLQGSIWRVQSAWEGFKVSLAKATEGSLRPWLDGVAKIIGGIAKVLDSPIGKFFASMTVGALTTMVVVNSLRAAIIGLAYAFRTMNVSVQTMGSSTVAALKFMTGGMARSGQVIQARSAMAAAVKSPGGVTRTTPLRPVTQTPTQPQIKPTYQTRTLVPTGFVGDPKYRVRESGQFVSGKGIPDKLRDSGYTKTMRVVSPVYPAGYVPAPGRQLTGAGLAAARRASLAAPAVINAKAVTGVMGLVKPMTKAAAVTGALARVGGGLLSVLGGPVGIAIMAGSFLIPWLITKLSNNTTAVDKNTQVIEDANAVATQNEYYALLANRKVSEAVQIISQNLAVLVRERKLDMDKVNGILESSNLPELVELMGKATLGSSEPLVIEPY